MKKKNVNKLTINDLKEFYLQIPELIKKDENKWIIELGLHEKRNEILKKIIGIKNSII